MRYIFVDEAGTSFSEPVTVVVGIIVDADAHMLLAERLVSETLASVPSTYAEDFVFHATDILAGSKYSEWRLTDRLQLLEAMMGIPRKVGMAITLSATWRGSVSHPELQNKLKLSQPQVEHMMTFGSCLAVADRNIRKHAGPSEVATVVAEDVPGMRKHLRGIVNFYRKHPVYLRAEHLRTTPKDIEVGYSTQNGDFRIARIRKSIHFVEKREDPLMQIADAVAFGFRRYFAKEKFGNEFVRWILGSEELLRNFASPSGTECWWPRPPHSSHGAIP